MQNEFKAVLMRGGTSKAIFFHENNMPKNKEKWSEFLLDVMGSPDIRQIDGLGGANSLTSKVAIIKKSKEKSIDIDYTFAQVSLNQPTVAFNSNCGNISSAVGLFAVNEGLVEPTDPITTVRIRNTNTGKEIIETVPTSNNKALLSGDCVIPGVPNSSAELCLTFIEPQGSVTGKLLPTGNAIDEIDTSIGKIKVSIVDAASPLVFVEAKSLGLKGTELPDEFDKKDLDFFEEIRSVAAEISGIAKREVATKASPAVPKIAIVSSKADYVDNNGNFLSKDNMDILIRMMSMQKPHQALAITGAICTSVAAYIPGTIVNKIASGHSNKLRLGHPGGIMTTKVEVQKGDVKDVSVIRTARRLMKGTVFTKKFYDV